MVRHAALSFTSLVVTSRAHYAPERSWRTQRSPSLRALHVKAANASTLHIRVPRDLSFLTQPQDITAFSAAIIAHQYA